MTLEERYRAQAKWARDQGEKAETPELRAQWLDLAQTYERLASHHDQAKRP